MTEERPTIGERYAIATASGNLTPLADKLTDADILLAAGIAASGDRRKRLALAAYRLGAQRDSTGLGVVVQEMDAWLCARLRKGGARFHMPAAAREALIVDTLRWWIDPVCRYCGGTGFITVEGTSRLSTMACDVCHGTTRRPLAREVPSAYADHAIWMVGELDRLVSIITENMARLLSQRKVLDL